MPSKPKAPKPTDFPADDEGALAYEKALADYEAKINTATSAFDESADEASDESDDGLLDGGEPTQEYLDAGAGVPASLEASDDAGEAPAPATTPVRMDDEQKSAAVKDQEIAANRLPAGAKPVDSSLDPITPLDDGSEPLQIFDAEDNLLDDSGNHAETVDAEPETYENADGAITGRASAHYRVE